MEKKEIKRTNDPVEAVEKWMRHWSDEGEFEGWTRDQMAVFAEDIFRNVKEGFINLKVGDEVTYNHAGIKKVNKYKYEVISISGEKIVTRDKEPKAPKANYVFENTFGVEIEGPAFGWMTIVKEEGSDGYPWADDSTSVLEEDAEIKTNLSTQEMIKLIIDDYDVAAQKIKDYLSIIKETPLTGLADVINYIDQLNDKDLKINLLHTLKLIVDSSYPSDQNGYAMLITFFKLTEDTVLAKLAEYSNVDGEYWKANNSNVKFGALEVIFGFVPGTLSDKNKRLQFSSINE